MGLGFRVWGLGFRVYVVVRHMVGVSKCGVTVGLHPSSD